MRPQVAPPRSAALAALALALAAGPLLAPPGPPSPPTPPAWWSTGPDPVLLAGAAVNDAGPVTLGQAKWFTKRALDTLDGVVPTVATTVRTALVGTGKIIPALDPPANPDAAWYEAQRQLLLVGQLKAIGKEFYDAIYNALNTRTGSDAWLKAQMDLYGTREPAGTGSSYYPWTEATATDDSNYGPASLGQLKAIFSLRLTESADGDDAPDLLEHAAIGTVHHPITGYQDSDGDGTSDIAELGANLSPSGRDIDGDGGNDDTDPNMFQPDAVRPINGRISPNGGGAATPEFWMDPGESTIQLYYWMTSVPTGGSTRSNLDSDHDPTKVTVAAVAGGSATTVAPTIAQDTGWGAGGSDSWGYIITVTPDDFTSDVTITVRYDHDNDPYTAPLNAWSGTYTPKRLNTWKITQPLTVTPGGGGPSTIDANTYGPGEVFPMMRSEGGDYKLSATFDVEGADSGYKMVLSGIPDQDAQVVTAGDTSEDLSFKVPSFALAGSQVSLTLVRDSDGEVLYRTPIALGGYGLLTGWSASHIYDGPTLPPSDPKCAPCSTSSPVTETDRGLPPEDGSECAAGYTTFDSTSDNRVEVTLSVGVLANGDGAALLGPRTDNIGGSAAGGGASLPAAEDPAKPDSLQLAATESAKVTMDAADKYPATVETATGVAKVESVVSNGYTLSYYRTDGTTLETRIKVVRPTTLEADGSQALRYIEERFSRTAGSTGSIVETKYTQKVNPDGGTTWKIYQGAELATTTSVAAEADFLRKTEIEVGAERNGERVERVSVYEMPANLAAGAGNWALVSQVDNYYRRHGWGDPIFRRVVDPEGRKLVTTWTHYTDAADDFKTGLPKEYRDHTGYWTDYEWDAHGRLIKAKEPFLDAAPGAADNLSQVFSVVYSGTAAPLSRRETTKVKGTPIAEDYITGPIASPFTSRSKTRVSAIGGTAGLTTTITREPAGEVWGGTGTPKFQPDAYQVSAITYPDGTKLSCTWTYKGTDNETRERDCKRGNTALTRGTRTVTETDPLGNTLITKRYALDFNGTAGNSQPLSTLTLSALDGLGRPETATTSFEDGSANQVTTRKYGCCGLAESTDIRGVVTEYHRDHLKRPETSTSLGVSRGTQYNGLTRRTLRFPKPTGAPHLVSGHVTVRATTDPTGTIVGGESVYNVAREHLTSRAPSPGHTDGTTLVDTAYSYAYGAGVTTTATYPDGGTSVADAHRDGRVASVTGTAVDDRSYEYGTSLTGVTFSNGAVYGSKTIEAVSTQWTANMVNLLGQDVLTYFADDATATRHYNAEGLLEKSLDPDGVRTFFKYNDEAQRVFTILDLDDDDTVDWASDRVTFSQGEYVNAHDTVWDTSTPPQRVSGSYAYETVTRVYRNTTDDSSLPASPEGLLVAKTQRGIDGLRGWSLPYGDANRLATTVTALDASDDDWTVTATAADGRKTVSTYDEGLLIEVLVKGGNAAEVLSEVDYTYDTHNRVDKATDARTGATKLAYTNSDQVASSTLERATGTTDDLVTAYTYDTMGRTLTTDLPDSADSAGGNLTNVVTRTYDPRGNTLTVTGGGTHDQTYTYDGLSRALTLVTKYGDAGGGAGTDQTTAWTYDGKRGWTTAKRHADNKGPDYSYTSAGRLKGRTWARGTYTEYLYDGAGQLTDVKYYTSSAKTAVDPDTPALAYRYKRWGAVDEVDDVSGSREFFYRENDDLLVSTEDLGKNSTALPQQQVTMPKRHSHVYETAAQGVPGRLRELQWGHSLDHDADLASGYAYDAETGRLEKASHGPVATSTNTFTYAYLANSNLVSTVTGPQHTVTNSYESHRNLRTRTKSNDGTNDQVDHGYAYNNIGQRDAASFGGAAYGTAADGTWLVGYNANGEVARTDRYDDVDLAPTGTKTDDLDYTYDPVGNRLTFTSADSGGTKAWSYYGDAAETAPGGDSLNQYRRIDTPTGDLDRAHDDDGNLTDDGTLTYKWDAENRLIEVRKKSGDVQIAEYLYDYMGRRIWKEVYSTATGGVVGETLYAYCGWNLAAEYPASSSKTITGTTGPARTYTWGADLSGSLQGAGGVGGLLAIQEHSGTHSGLHFPAYDGNGNVAAVLDDSTGDDEAWYVYDAFGKSFATSSGGYTDENPFRFSTKYLDRESGLYYYGLRYYSTGTGRWISRDPIQEGGGLNLYGFVYNSSINWYDYLGLNPYPNQIDPSHDFWQGGGWNCARCHWTPAQGHAYQSAGSEYFDSIFGALSSGVEFVLPISSVQALLEGRLLVAAGDLVLGKLKIVEKAAGGVMMVGGKCCVKVKGSVSWFKKPKRRSGGEKIETCTPPKITNPVPNTMARVIPGKGPYPTLGPPGRSDVYVTAADDIAGLTPSQISRRLTIDPSDTFTIVKFPTPNTGVASPVFRSDPGFIGRGRTAGGAREFVIPNGPIPSGSSTTVVGP